MAASTYIVLGLLIISGVINPALGQGSPFGVHVTERGLRQRVFVTPSGRTVLKHSASTAHPDINERRDVLSYAFYGPIDGDIRLHVTPREFSTQCRIQRSGSFGGAPVYTLIVDPCSVVSEGRKVVADSFHVSVQWDQALTSAAYAVPPVSAPFLNPTWRAIARPTRDKHAEASQGNVSPQQWYDRFAQYKRVHTSRDGIAVIRGSDLLSSGAGIPFDNVVLYWRGIEQPIYINDADSSGSFTNADGVYFQGRRASGDSSWYDSYDSTAVFYVSVKGALGQRKRILPLQVANAVADTIRQVVVREHFEIDTGYFHPGSGVDDDHSIFESSPVALEGFYWRSLYGRGKEYARFSTRFTPADSGSIIWQANIATTTSNAKYTPEHIVSIWSAANQQPERLEIEGYQSIAYMWKQQVSKVPSGQQTVIVQATGSDELRQNTDWYSEVLVDGFDIEGDALPVLDSGRLHCTVRVSDSSALVLKNVHAGPIFILDTARQLMRIHNGHVSGITVRTGIQPSIVPDVAWDGVSFDATVTIGSTTIRIDSLRSQLAIVTVDTLTGSVSVKRDLTNERARELLSAKGRSEFVVVINSGNTPDQQLIDELQNRGVPAVETDVLHVWMAAAANGQGSFSNRSGMTAHLPVSYGRDGTSSIALQRGIHQFYIADQVGIEYARVLPARNQGINADTAFGDIIAISFGDYLQQASRWATHRYAQSGKKVALYDVESVFEEYDAGRHTPHAIRAFLADAFSKARTKPTHCVLIGNASWDIRQAVKAGNVAATRVDQVPTYGRPSTDMWFGLLDDESDLSTPELIISRFPVSTQQECEDLINKIITADTQRYTPSLRRFLYVGGGTEQENFCEMYKRMLDDSFGSEIVFTAPPLCIDTVTVCNTDYEKPGLQIREKLQQGVAWMNYIGHGGTDVFDIKDWDPQDLRNTERYPIMATFSCLTGNYSSPSSLCENAAYLVEGNKGVVAAMGSTGYQYLPVVDLLHFRYHEAMLTKGLRTIGELTYEAKRGFATMNNQLGRNAALQYCILGDPFTRLRIDTSADVQVYDNSIRIGDRDGQPAVFVQQDSLYVDVAIWNSGIATSIPVDAVIRRYIGNSSQAVDSIVFAVPEGTCSQYSYRAAFATQTAGRQRICVQIDPKRYTPDNIINNLACREFDVVNRSMTFVDPLEYGTVDVRKPRFRLLYPYVRTDTTREVATVSIHSSYQDAAAMRNPVLVDYVRRDHGTYVDIEYKPTDAEQQSIRDTSTYWARCSSSGSDPIVLPFVFRRDAIAADEHTLYADGVIRLADSVVIDSSSHTLKLGKRTIGVSVQSSSSLTSDPVRNPSLRIAFGDTVLQSSFRNGLNIAVLRPFSTSPRVIRRYDTSPTPAPVETGHYGGAAECLAFLRDSIYDHEYLVVAACNESFTDFLRTSTLDQLKDALRSFGSMRAGEIDAGTAYAFIGSRNPSFKAVESLVAPTATGLAIINDSVLIRYPGAFVRRVVVERPRHLKSIRTEYSSEQTSIVTLTDYSGESYADTMVTSWTAPRNSSTIKTATIDLRLHATDKYPDPHFSSSTFIYEPAPLIYVDSTMIEVTPEDCLRGDSVEVKVATKNLQTRFTSPEATLTTHLSSVTDSLERQEVSNLLPEIQEDGSTTATVFGYNNPSWAQVAVRTALDYPGPQRSFVSLFQSASKRYVPKEDTSAPSIQVEVHGRAITSGDYVDSLPVFTIKILDSSKLPIVRDENIVAFVNGFRIRSGTVQGYSFLTTDDCLREFPNSNVRAAMRFAYPMDNGENLLIARVTDANGNKDTAEVFLTYSNITAYTVESTAPNPASTSVRFEVATAGRGPTQSATFRVYDQQGRLVSQAPISLAVGVDTFTWDARTNDGSSLAPGVYFWTLTDSEDSQVRVENRTTGMITIMR